MKFLKEAIEQTSRRLKFQEWILLALRCLVILLLALALARPGAAVRRVDRPRRGRRRRARRSTRRTAWAPQDGDKTRLDRAKEAALGVSTRCRANSSVQIFACADRADAPRPEVAVQPRPGPATHPDDRRRPACPPTSSPGSPRPSTPPRAAPPRRRRSTSSPTCRSPGSSGSRGRSAGKCEEITRPGEPRLRPLRQRRPQGRRTSRSRTCTAVGTIPHTRPACRSSSP